MTEGGEHIYPRTMHIESVVVFLFLFFYTMNVIVVSVRFSVKISKIKAGYRDRRKEETYR